MMISVFISHSHTDAELVTLLITLLRSALNLPSGEIRATSVDGYRLPGGANVNDRLRSEVQDARVLVGVISKASIGSDYVTFELGARWGSGKPMIPLLASDVDGVSLAGPLKGINALSCNSSPQLHQFIEDMAAHLEVKADRPAAYQKCVDEILEFIRKRRASTSEPVHAADAAPQDGPPTIVGAKPGRRGPYIGQPGLADAERHAVDRLREGASPTEVAGSLERRGISRRVAREMTEELKKHVGRER
jgi:hypothetical protein